MSENRREDHETTPPASLEPAGYEPPRIETSLTTDDLEREVLYAGRVTPPS